jgi:chaperonin cofactor prefoldin
MDSLQTQIVILSSRVDELHQMIEQLTDKITEVLSEGREPATSGYYSAQPGISVRQYSHANRRNLDFSMEHKDVLVDTNYPESDSQTGDRALSPEVQIQRLTAQLTAAYNRIAALEEQLLAQRIH